MDLQERLHHWLGFWQKSLPTNKRGMQKKMEWEASIDRFMALLKDDIAKEPLSLWLRIRILYQLQKALALQGVPAEALRPLVLGIVLRVYLA